MRRGWVEQDGIWFMGLVVGGVNAADLGTFVVDERLALAKNLAFSFERKEAFG